MIRYKLPSVVVVLCLSIGCCLAKDLYLVQGSQDHRFIIASKLDDQGDYKRAFALYSELAQERDDPAILALCILYEKGLGVPKNSAMVVQWLQKGADWHLPKCLWALGTLYSTGSDGLAQSDAKCAELMRESADLGCTDAMVTLGSMYGDGKGGLVQSDHKAVALYLKAANLGNAEGMFMMGVTSSLGVVGPPSQPEAVKWFKKAIDVGYIKAYADYGLSILHMHYPTEAVAIFKKGAALGLSDCMYQLGFSYEVGIRHKNINMKLAISWYKKAAKLGDQEAKDALHRLGY